MERDSNWTRLRTGLTVKLVAMWVLLGAVIVPLAIPSELGLFLAIVTPLTIDFVGRCLCTSPAPRPWMIRLSIAAQLVGIGCLLACFTMFPTQEAGDVKIPVGVVIGAALAAVWQTASARLFVAHLQAIAQLLGRDDLNAKLNSLRNSVFRTAFAFYGVGVISFIVIAAALLFGIIAYVIGLIITLPLAFLFLVPLWMTCMVFYFLMLYSYQATLIEFRAALTNAVTTPPK